MTKLAAFALALAVAATTSLLVSAPAYAADRTRPPVNEKVDRVFARLDADHDGRISRSEAEPARRLARRFDKLDADRDGYVTRGELTAAIERHRGHQRQ
jgi:Ca2+-binding EF-hand superfamily protein